MKPLTFGSLFSGIGGFDLGLERAGMECRWQVEIDPFCQRVLEKHWPNVTRYGDITQLDFTEVEPVDLICGGFPCQPVSLAGQRRGQNDERWLWPEFARAIRMVRPRYALMENVPGLLGLGMGDVLGDLSELGYDAEWQSIPAAAVGAPHLRWRVWIVAYPNADSGGRKERQELYRGEKQSPANWNSCREYAHRFRDSLAHSNCERQQEQCGAISMVPQFTSVERRSVFTNANSEPLGRLAEPRGQCSQWATEPAVGRVADGVPHRVDRLRSLGNAIVPQVAEYIGRLLLAQLAEAAA